jgi:prophage maintenance system killer protein
VEDAQKRTAYTVTATFLETNGYAMAEKEEAKIIRFIKYDMLLCDESQIKEWMKDGKIPKSA